MTSWRPTAGFGCLRYRYLLPVLAGAGATGHLPRHQSRADTGKVCNEVGSPATIGITSFSCPGAPTDHAFNSTAASGPNASVPTSF
jgi:hypothetical protein